MPTVISEAIFAAEKRLSGFENQVFLPHLYLLRQSGHYISDYMPKALVDLRESGWAGTVAPNLQDIYGDDASIFLHFFNDSKGKELSIPRDVFALYQILRLSDGAFKQALFDFHQDKTKKQFVRKPSSTPSAEKKEHWKRHLALLVAAFAYSMVTNENVGKYWALTQETYKPETLGSMFNVTQFTASIAHTLQKGLSADVVTFLPLTQKPDKIEFTERGVLKKTWD